MKKTVGIGVAVGAIVVALVALGVVFWTRSQSGDNGSNAEMSDALKFKEAYESLNNTVREGTSSVYSPVEIPEKNMVKYVTVAEAMEVLDMKDAVLYVGANWCPWCRGVITTLLSVAAEYDKPLYYLNLDDEKSLFEVQDGKLVETRHGSDEYYRLLDKLSEKLKAYTVSDKDTKSYSSNNILQNYVLTGKDGKKYDTNEKRIYQPDVYGIKDGKIVARMDETVELNEGQTPYDSLTDKQKEQLKKAYQELFAEVYGDVPLDACGSKDEHCD